MGLIECPVCEKNVSSQAVSCPNCGHPIKKPRKSQETGKISCPNCKSTSGPQKISGASKVGSAAVFGVFSMGKITKTYQCKSCGYRW